MHETADHSAPDALDPELAELPGPPQGRRVLTLALMALVVVASAALALSLRHDVAYFFSRGETIELGDAAQLDPAELAPNTQVRVSGTPMLSRTVHYRRVLTGSTYVVFPLGAQRTIYVHAPAGDDALASAEFTGRLVTFDDLGGRIGSVEGYLADRMDLPVSGESYLLLSGESPGSYAWALLLVLLCIAFIAVDVWLFVRWFLPSKAGESGGGESAV